MKKIFLVATIAVFLLTLSVGINGQNVSSKLDQSKLMLQFIGNWQRDAGKDTVELWECSQYGKAYLENVFLVIKGKKTPYYTNNICFDPKTDIFKGFTLWANGYYGTWLCSFKTEKSFAGDFVQNFNPELVTRKTEIIFESPTTITWILSDKEGKKTGEYKFLKVK
jgi:hypothetical protein